MSVTVYGPGRNHPSYVVASSSKSETIERQPAGRYWRDPELYFVQQRRAVSFHLPSPPQKLLPNLAKTLPR